MERILGIGKNTPYICFDSLVYGVCCIRDRDIFVLDTKLKVIKDSELSVQILVTLV